MQLSRDLMKPLATKNLPHVIRCRYTVLNWAARYSHMRRQVAAFRQAGTLSWRAARRNGWLPDSCQSMCVPCGSSGHNYTGFNRALGASDRLVHWLRPPLYLSLLLATGTLHLVDKKSKTNVLRFHGWLVRFGSQKTIDRKTHGVVHFYEAYGESYNLGDCSLAQSNLAWSRGDNLTSS